MQFGTEHGSITRKASNWLKPLMKIRRENNSSHFNIIILIFERSTHSVKKLQGPEHCIQDTLKQDALSTP